MEDRWLHKAKRLHAIATTGLHYTDSPFDRERYAEIAALASAMLADLGNVPLARIDGLITQFTHGYATPKVDVRAAVFRDDRILLVQERTDGRWTMPGGFADVGLTPGQNVAKEVHEEAGLHVVPERLYCVRHKATHAYDPDVREFYKLFFLCTPLDEHEPCPGHETLAAGYFARDGLPPLSTARVLESDIAAAFAAHADCTLPVLFD
ncbi:NUDIX hydrolase [Candidatus Binatia bacterium]|nr:NUDIX hydrolase [Candidatus Binatia bacterium]